MIRIAIIATALAIPLVTSEPASPRLTAADAQTILNAFLTSDEAAFIGAIDAALWTDIVDALASDTPLQQCAQTAVSTCGQGQVCWVCVGGNSCAFSCRDGNGQCTVPIPPGCFSNKKAADLNDVAG